MDPIKVWESKGTHPPKPTHVPLDSRSHRPWGVSESEDIFQVNPNLAFIISQFPEEWMFLAKRRFIETWERGRFFFGGER